MAWINSSAKDVEVPFSYSTIGVFHSSGDELKALHLIALLIADLERATSKSDLDSAVECSSGRKKKGTKKKLLHVDNPALSFPIVHFLTAVEQLLLLGAEYDPQF